MAIVFVQASAGTAITGASGTASLTGCVAGNVIIVHRYQDGPGANITYSGITNCSDLAGSAGNITGFSGTQVGSPLVGAIRSSIGRVTANGTCSFDIASSSGDDAFVQIYEFSGVSLGTTLATVVENGAGTTDQDQGTDTTMTPPPVVTNGTNRLAVALFAVNADQSVANFAGESGGDWTKPATHFNSATGTAGTVGIQTAPLAAAGTLSGGSATITSAGWGILAFALIPAPVADSPTTPFGFLSWLS